MTSTVSNMADNVDESNKDSSAETDPNAISSSQKSGENIVASENADPTTNEESEATTLPSAGAEAGEPNQAPATDDPEPEKSAPSNDEPKENSPGDEPVELNPPTSTEHSGEHVPSLTDNAVTENNPPPSEGQPAGTDSPSPNDESQKIEPVATSDEPTEDPELLPENEPPEPVETNLVDDESLKKMSRSSTGETDADPTLTPVDAVQEEITTEVIDGLVEESPQKTSDKTYEKPTEPSLEELARKASGSASQKKSKTENSSLTARLYEKQIKTGKLNRLTSVVEDEDGTKRLVNPGSVPHWNTVDISLAGKRPMSSEKCRKGEHNCFESAAARRERALSASLAQGLYPDFMRLNPKLNEFVAASILEKLRLKGLAAPLHLYRGRYLPPDLLAEMVLKPKKKKITDRYYFGYVPPPNRPRISTEFRRYLDQFTEQHKAAESDLCYSYALKRVRQLAGRSDDHTSLPQTLAEVVRAQEEPGFGVKQLRRPHTAVI